MPAAKFFPTMQDHDHAAGHVFPTVIPHSVNHRGRAEISKRETFARESADEKRAAVRAVKAGVANDAVILPLESCVSFWPNDDLAAAMPCLCRRSHSPRADERDFRATPKMHLLARAVS